MIRGIDSVLSRIRSDIAFDLQKTGLMQRYLSELTRHGTVAVKLCGERFPQNTYIFL